MHPPNPQQQREEVLRKEESRKDEQERRQLESLLWDFDALDFYEKLSAWGKAPIPQPVPHEVRVTPLRQKIVMYQPLPLSRRELSDLRKLSRESARLLYLLRALDQRGMECPYIHQQNKQILENVLEKCERLKAAGKNYMEGRGLWARLTQLLNKIHVDAIKKDAESFKNKIEAVLLMCRHQEFAQDLKTLRSAMSSYSIQMPTSQQPVAVARPTSNKGVPNMMSRGFSRTGPTKS